MRRRLIGLLFSVFAIMFLVSMVVIHPAYATFEDFTAESGITPMLQGDDAVAAVDFDNDGYLDLAIAHRRGSGNGLRLYENDRTGHFSDITESTGLGIIEGIMLSWADFDNDGDQDFCFVTIDNLLLFLNELAETGSLTFVQLLAIPGNWRLPSWVDYDNDGDLDLYVGGLYDRLQPNAMFRNNLKETGTVTFTDVTVDVELSNSNNDDTQSIAWIDVDNDGDMDLYLTKGSGASGYAGSDQLFRNNLKETNDARFTEITTEVDLDASKTYAFSGTWADYDNDGDMDLYLGLGQSTDNKLFHNNLVETGLLNFTNFASSANVTSPNDGGTAEWADFDNDGDLDLLANGVSYEPWVLHKNEFLETATPHFINVTTTEGIAALPHVRGTLFFDMDNDGDLDLLVVRVNPPGGFKLYRNNRPGASALQVILEGTKSNSDGTGARLVLSADGQQQFRCAYRNVIHDASGGWQGQQRIHFGLGNIESVDELVIYWPSGCVQTLMNIPIGQVIKIKESCINEVAPVANARENISISSEAQNSTTIMGCATDPDGDPLEYRWIWIERNIELSPWQPVGPNCEAPLDLSTVPDFPVGVQTLLLQAYDGESLSEDNIDARMTLTIENSSPHPAPTGGGTYQVWKPVTLGGEVSDYDGDWVYYEWIENSVALFSGSIQAIYGGEAVTLPEHSKSDFSIGQHILKLVVDDGVNDPVESDDVLVEVRDDTAPTLAPVPDKSILWPPNHKMVNIIIESNASDNSGQSVTLTAEVSSNEPQDGLGDGDMSPDWTEPAIDQESGIISFQLRAERSGSGNGRVYTITITATDSSGNSSRAEVKIIVPHDKKK